MPIPRPAVARPLLSWLVLAALAPLLRAGDEEGAFLVVDPTSAESMYVANYYRAARDLPEGNFLHLEPGASDYPAFAAVNVPALLGTVAARRLDDRLDYAIVMPGSGFYVPAPGLISDSCAPVSRIALSAAYGLARQADQILGGMYSTARNHFQRGTDEGIAFHGSTTWWLGESSDDPRAQRYCIGALLGYTGARGNTLAEVLDLIDRSVAVDGTAPAGTFYFMQTTDAARSSPRHGAYPGTVAAIVAAGGQAQHLYADLPLGQQDCLGIMTGLANPTIDTGNFTLLPGSFADHLTSYAATFDTSSQTKCSRWLAKGASGTSGAVQEPCNYPGKFPHAEYHLVYFQGMTLGEAWLRKVTYLPFQGLLLGDPLTAPWASYPVVDVPSPPTGPVTGVLTLSPAATATAAGAQIARLELLVDGVHAQWIDPGGDFHLDTTGYADGWHELRVLATDDTPVENTGRWIGAVEVANHGLAATLSVSPTAGDLATPFDFTFTATGDTVREVRLWSNGRVVAAGTGASGTLRLFGQNLGAGPVRVRVEALFTGGGAARSAAVDVPVTYAPGTPAGAAPAAFSFEKRVFVDHAFVVELPTAHDDDPSLFTFTVLQHPAQATLLSAGTGPYRVYQPLPGASGTDFLTYQVSGPGGASSVETVSLVYGVLPAVDPLGCGVNPSGSILLRDGTPALGRAVTVGLDNPLGTQNPGALAFLALSLAPTANYPCGVLVDDYGMAGPDTQGELLVNVLPPDPLDLLGGSPWAGVGTPVEFTVAVPSLPGLAGATVFAQGLLFDPTAPPAGPKFALTDGLEMTVGHP